MDSSNSSTKSGNTRGQISPAKHWFFTCNNFTEEDITLITGTDSSIVPKYIFEKEDEGTPHLQGHLSFRDKIRPLSFFDTKKFHFEKTRNTKAASKYCLKDFSAGKITKDCVYARGYELPYTIEIELYDWQEDIINILDCVADDRSIYWFWEPYGNTGKTTFQKWLFTKYKELNIVVLSGNAHDMKNGIIQYEKLNEKLPKLVLVNIPRSKASFVSYAGLEEIKDMFFFSGKYEGGMVCGENPHLLVFANTEPDYAMMSNDRWKVTRLNESI